MRNNMKFGISENMMNITQSLQEVFNIVNIIHNIFILVRKKWKNKQWQLTGLHFTSTVYWHAQLDVMSLSIIIINCNVNIVLVWMVKHGNVESKAQSTVINKFICTKYTYYIIVIHFLVFRLATVL